MFESRFVFNHFGLIVMVFYYLQNLNNFTITYLLLIEHKVLCLILIVQ